MDPSLKLASLTTPSAIFIYLNGIILPVISHGHHVVSLVWVVSRE
ncbi:hypothetical protein FOXB_15165 [Fusarium oxysporum f. sp. conglutinans Fo5176]|uniref:Uncharacterized protein n=1 Tax=Fusarium oxysporum (strain Fo5176) TaxID=660025 RepID=F9G933_FUSOF|nr:hypothetical protein FOXB_15165 [Fusarium oxysporum f. sp. conglutinans Fo5176]